MHSRDQTYWNEYYKFWDEFVGAWSLLYTAQEVICSLNG